MRIEGWSIFFFKACLFPTTSDPFFLTAEEKEGANSEPLKLGICTKDFLSDFEL